MYRASTASLRCPVCSRMSHVGSDAIAAVVTYLKRQAGKQLAKRLGVSQIDEQADTNEPSYFKQTSKKTTLLVSAASEVFVGNDHVRYQSAVACQQVR